jgi:hypothetical protein
MSRCKPKTAIDKCAVYWEAANQGSTFSFPPVPLIKNRRR